MILSTIALLASLDWNEMKNTNELADCKTIWTVCVDKGCEKTFNPPDNEIEKIPFKNPDFHRKCMEEIPKNGNIEAVCAEVEKYVQEQKLCKGKLHDQP